MKLFISLICLIGVTFGQFDFRADECDNVSKTYCLNEKQYVLCNVTEGGDAPAILSCPIEDEYCAPDVASSCSANTTEKTTNTHCNTCAMANGHACISFNTFKTCENGAPTGNETTCVEGLYCDAYHPNRENPCRRFSGQQFLCWKKYVAPIPPTEAEICEQLNQEGNHEYEEDVDCTQ